MAVVAVVAITAAIGLQTFRVLAALAFNFGERWGDKLAGILILLPLGAIPLIAAALRSRFGSRRALWLAIAALALSFAALQQVEHKTVPLAAAVMASALLALALELPTAWPYDGGQTFVVGLLLGSAIDAALKTAFYSWDLVWQEGFAPAAVVLGLGLLIACSLAAWRPEEDAAQRPPPPPWTAAILGPYLALNTLFLQNPAFVASQAGISIPGAGAVVLLGSCLGLAGFLVRNRIRPRAAVDGVVALTLVVIAATITMITGSNTLLEILVGSAATAWLLAIAVVAPSPAVMLGDSSPWRRALTGRRGARWVFGAVAIGTLLCFLMVVMLYQFHYYTPLPLSNRWLPVFAAGAMGLVLFCRKSERETGNTTPWWALGAVCLLLIVPVAARSPDGEETATATGAFDLMTYNVHFGIDPYGQMDLERLATVIERQDPDLVALQEVTRGWVMSGMTDVAEWLSRRLNMSYVYAPAADGQFGNLVLTALPIRRAETGFLPKGSGPMRRSFVMVETGPPGERVTVIDTHLQHGEEQTPTRIEEIDVLLKRWDHTPRTVLAGDLNPQEAGLGRDRPEIERLLAAGFLSVQDEIGDPDEPTTPSLESNDDSEDFEIADEVKSDWILITPGVSVGNFDIVKTTASDHFPLTVTVYPRRGPNILD